MFAALLPVICTKVKTHTVTFKKTVKITSSHPSLCLGWEAQHIVTLSLRATWYWTGTSRVC